MPSGHLATASFCSPSWLSQTADLLAIASSTVLVRADGSLTKEGAGALAGERALCLQPMFAKTSARQVARFSRGHDTDVYHVVDVSPGLLSALLSIILYKASRFYTPFISKTYKTLSLTDQRNWDTRWVCPGGRVSMNLGTTACGQHAGRFWGPATCCSCACAATQV